VADCHVAHLAACEERISPYEGAGKLFEYMLPEERAFCLRRLLLFAGLMVREYLSARLKTRVFPCVYD